MTISNRLGQRWALLVLALVLTSAPTLIQAQSIGVVKSVQGSALIGRGSETLEARVGTDLLEGDTLQTLAGASLGATLADGTTISLGERSRATVRNFAFSPRRDLFDLLIRVLSGRFLYTSGRIGETRPDRVTIETPQLTVATRGTRFALILPKDPL
ncbi:MAG: FecR domain-containing protein [Pseudomonadota bacterium]